MRFSEVIGPHQVKTRLVTSVREGRVSHAQLFSGGEGGYGLSLALAYASYILCLNKLEDDSCGACAACIKSDKLTLPDLHFSFPVVTTPQVKDKPKSSDFLSIWRETVLRNHYVALDEWYESIGVETKQGFISVEEAADIIRKMSLRPFESENKVLIIWLPEKMRDDAANKLLKLIEEPPYGTVFILVTEDHEQLLPTILSRTQLVKLPVLDATQTSQILMQYAGSSQSQAVRIARIANGNLSLALSMVQDQEEEKTVSMEHDFMYWMRICYNPFLEKDGNFAWVELNNWIDEITKMGKEHLKRFLAFCLDASRDCLLKNVGAGQISRFDDEFIPEIGRAHV